MEIHLIRCERRRQAARVGGGHSELDDPVVLVIDCLVEASHGGLALKDGLGVGVGLGARVVEEGGLLLECERQAAIAGGAIIEDMARQEAVDLLGVGRPREGGVEGGSARVHRYHMS